jgi:hypothetical protein
MSETHTNKATVTDQALQEAFMEGFTDDQPDSGTTDDVPKPMELTVEDLMVLLGDMPADAKVALITRHGEAESFTVTLDENTSWVLLEG